MKLDLVIAWIEQAENCLARAREELQEALGNGMEQQPANVKILREVANRGGSVSRYELHRIATEAGMSTRGLGGFFSRAGASLQYDGPRRERVCLTEKGYHRLQEASINSANSVHGRRGLQSIQGLQREPLELPGTPLSRIVMEERKEG